MNSKILSKLLKIPEKEAQLLIDFVDIDGDGQIDDYDFIAMVGLFTMTSFDEKLEAIFYLFDEDYSQIISFDELQRFIKCIICVNARNTKIKKSEIALKIQDLRNSFFLENDEMKLQDFIQISKEDEDISSALKTLGIISENEL